MGARGGGRAPMIGTLGELISFIEESGTVPASRLPYLRSALNRTRALLGQGLPDVQAEPKALLQQLDRRCQVGVERANLPAPLPIPHGHSGSTGDAGDIAPSLKG